MQDNVVMTTLLNAMLQNQHAITDALVEMAGWMETVEDDDGDVVAGTVRESLKVVENNKAIIGMCLKELMRGQG